MVQFQLTSALKMKKANSQMIRLKEIADVCCVNVSTVSRALKDDPRVKADTRKKIHAAASRMGYTPNWAAQSLKGVKPTQYGY